MENSNVLLQSPVFKNLTLDRLEKVLKNATWRVRKYDKGEMVAQAGEECHYLLIVLSGSVKGEMTDASGRVIKIEDIPAPRPIAFSFVFGEMNRFPVNVTATEESRIFMVPRPDLLIMMQADQQVLLNMLNAISSRAQFLSEKIRLLSLKSIKGKIADYLLELSKKQGGNTIELPSTQSELADYFGIARPSLARTLGEMAAEGALKVDRRRVTIVDKASLLQMLK